jgi:hypothetical protein
VCPERRATHFATLEAVNHQKATAAASTQHQKFESIIYPVEVKGAFNLPYITCDRKSLHRRWLLPDPTSSAHTRPQPSLPLRRITMATTFSNGSTSAGIDPNVMKLPEHVDGFIDLEILIDIHKCLSESKFEDDRTLGAWVKANYLQGPINPQKESARPIRNSEGFVNLDKAYRRARTLTGKAQDKWPFLNKDWKKLSSTFIKNAILGDVAMSVVRTEPSGGVRDTPMSNGLNGHRGKTINPP